MSPRRNVDYHRATRGNRLTSRTLIVVLALLAPAAAPARPFRIVLDPGHGGQAMGALGAYGVYEKYVTLAIALRLGRLLEADPDLVTFYTRKDDVHVELKDRSALANAVEADAFVSIHCNADPKGEAFGIETFYLGGDAEDPEAEEIARRENGGATGIEPAEDDPALGAILGDLRRNGNQQESAILAETVQRRLMREFPETTSRDVRQAHFAVLRRAAMPAIVIEVGFLTHPDEGRNLLLAPYQERLAVTLQEALRDHIRAVTRGPAIRRVPRKKSL